MAPSGSTIGIVGGSGMLGTAISSAILGSRAFELSTLWISNRSGKCPEIDQSSAIQVTKDNRALAQACDVVILCVPPGQFPDIDIHASDRLVISVMAGVTIEDLKSKTEAVRVVRAMSSPAASLLEQNIDATTPQGRMFFTMLSAVAEFETEIRKARQREGIDAALAKGSDSPFKGRPATIDGNMIRDAEGWNDAQRYANKCWVMMMKIEDRVIEAMQAGIDGNWAKGVVLICPAIEATARKLLAKQKVTRDEFKAFIRENYPIVEGFIGVGLNLNETVFPDICIKSDGDRALASPDFADIVYHAFRCSLAHGHEIGDEFAFTKSTSQGASHWVINGGDGRINMPDKVLWALIACVVFCKANADIATNTSVFLTWGGAPVEKDPPYRFDIDVFWGGEALVRRFLETRKLIRVAIKHQ